ncbi:MAG: exodeoxyribonuclease I [Pseudomonadota bacterium]
MATHTFLWHDYETFGVQPRRDRPAQFAAIRTDAELKEIGEPLMLYCKPAPDYLPDPQSCLITGITPQHCLQHGIAEHAFASSIEQAFSAAGTIGVGYNTIRFDDEITRFMFWRNLIDPYAREWQNNCGRWDILDLVRTAYALRPEGIEWPRHEDGRASFKLEDLTAANGLMHDSAHDALSDVRATIALARLIRQCQPKLFDFCVALHKKDRVAEEIGWPQQRPFLHVTGMVPAERGCLALMWPLAMHPTNRNELIVWDLAHDPRMLKDMDVAEIRLRMFTKADALPDDVARLPVKTIHLNKSPVVIGNLKTLSQARALHWQIDLPTAMAHAGFAVADPPAATVWEQVFLRPERVPADVDEDLYGAFIGNNDRRKLAELREMTPEKLATAILSFDDPRMSELVFRYRARNFPETLNAPDRKSWDQHRRERLFDGEADARTVEQLFDQIDLLSENMSEQDDRTEQHQQILADLYDYAEMIAPERI